MTSIRIWGASALAATLGFFPAVASAASAETGTGTHHEEYLPRTAIDSTSLTQPREYLSAPSADAASGQGVREDAQGRVAPGDSAPSGTHHEEYITNAADTAVLSRDTGSLDRMPDTTAPPVKRHPRRNSRTH